MSEKAGKIDKAEQVRERLRACGGRCFWKVGARPGSGDEFEFWATTTRTYIVHVMGDDGVEVYAPLEDSNSMLATLEKIT